MYRVLVQAVQAVQTSGWQRRFTIVGLCFVAFMLCNMDRVNMSIAILPMSKQYGWDSATIGLVQSSFFWWVGLQCLAGTTWCVAGAPVALARCQDWALSFAPGLPAANGCLNVSTTGQQGAGRCDGHLLLISGRWRMRSWRGWYSSIYQLIFPLQFHRMRQSSRKQTHEIHGEIYEPAAFISCIAAQTKWLDTYLCQQM